VRVHVVNAVTGVRQWHTIAYVPQVGTEKGPGGAERSRLRRCGILQRVLYLAFRSTIAASHDGVPIQDSIRGELHAFPRLILYQCDQPEERAVLCLKPGLCTRPCSTCNVNVTQLGAPEALKATKRDVVFMLEKQLEAAGHFQYGRERQRRQYLEKRQSLNSYAPALAGMAGLTTAPFLLYKIIGFDVLHVRLVFLLILALVCCSCRRGTGFLGAAHTRPFIYDLCSPLLFLSGTFTAPSSVAGHDNNRCWISESHGSLFTGW